MHIVLHLAISADGFIAKKDGDSSWVSVVDEELFKRRAIETGCLVVGKKTFDQYQGSIYPVKGALNLVLTTHEISVKDPAVVYVHSPEEAIAVAQKSGHNAMLVAGGARTSDTFLNAGLVNEIYLSVHQVTLGEGIKTFNQFANDQRYKLTGEKELSKSVKELHYSMV